MGKQTHAQYFLLLFTSVSLFCCQSPNAPMEKQEISAVEASDSLHAQAYNPLLPNPATGEISEYLEWSSIKINNRLPLDTREGTIQTVLGKPDSVVAIDWAGTCSSNFISDDSKLAYYSGMQFEKSGDSLYFQVNDFQKNHEAFLQSGSLRLDHTTTLDDIRKHFPNAVKNVSKLGVYGLDDVSELMDAIVLPLSKELSEGHWILMFQDGKLRRLDYWMPC